MWSTTGAELGEIGGEGLRLYFTLIKGLCLLWLTMATIMCGSLALNAGGEMYKLEASSHFSDLHSLELASVKFPGATPPADRQAWRSLRAGTTLGAITRSRSTILPQIELVGQLKKCWGESAIRSTFVFSSQSDKPKGSLCDCIPGFVPHSDDVGDLVAKCAVEPSHRLCSGISTETCPATTENSCEWSDDGYCDEDDGTCDTGTDCNDCGRCDEAGDFSCDPPATAPTGDCAYAHQVAPNCDCQEHSVQATAYSGGGLKEGSKCLDQVNTTERTLLLYSAFDTVGAILFIVGSVLLHRRMTAERAETNAAGVTMSDYSVLLEPSENWTLGGEQTPDSPAEFIRQLEEHLDASKWPVAVQKDGSPCIWPVYADSQCISHWAAKTKLIHGLVEQLAAATQAVPNEAFAEQARCPKVEKALEKLRKLNLTAKERNVVDGLNVRANVVEAAIVSLRREADRRRLTAGDQTIDFCGQKCISVVQAPEPSALSFGNFELSPTQRAMRARLSSLLQLALLGVVMILLQALYSSVPAVELPCDQMKYVGKGGAWVAAGNPNRLTDLGSHRKAWADNPQICTQEECDFVGGVWGSGKCGNILDPNKRGVCDGMAETSGISNEGRLASAVSEFYRLRWQLVKAAQTIAAYPSLETEGHNLPVCDVSEFSTTLAVAGKSDLVNYDIPWEQASSKGCHRKYDEEYPRFNPAVRLPLGSSLDASCYHCMCECYTSNKVMMNDGLKGVVLVWPRCPTMSGAGTNTEQSAVDDTVGDGTGDASANPPAPPADEVMMSYPQGAEARGMAPGYCDEYVEWKAGVNRRKTISSLAVTVVNQLAAIGWKQLIKFEKRVSVGKQHASLAQKVFVFQFLNTVGLTILLHSQFADPGLPVVGDGKWYYTVGADLIQVMMLNVVVPPTVHVLKFVAQRVLQSLAKAHTQAVLNKKFEPPAWNLAASLGEVLFISWTTLTLSTGMPSMLWIGAFGLGLKYWVEKWAVLRAYAKPPMYSADVFGSLPTHLYLMAVVHLMSACYFLKVSGGVTPESHEGSLNLKSPVKAVELVSGGTTVAEGAWRGGYGQAHVLLPLLLLVCLVGVGVWMAMRTVVQQCSNTQMTKVVEEETGAKEVSVVPHAVTEPRGNGADEHCGDDGIAPEFGVAMSQGLIINSHDNYEIQDRVELSLLQEELHTIFTSDATVRAKFGDELVKSILLEVGKSVS